MEHQPQRSYCSLVTAFVLVRWRQSRVKPLPVHHPARTVDPDWQRTPDSRICREALEVTREISPPHLLNHCLRSFFFGKQIARHDGIRYDPELLFLACIMHDWGLTPRHREGAGDFEERGARAAHHHLCVSNYEPARAAIVHDAIAWHTAVGAAAARGAEQALTHFGSGMDVAGFRREAMPPGFKAAVARETPRLGFKVAFTALLAEEVHRHPNSNIARMMRVGFDHRIAAAPFAE